MAIDRGPWNALVDDDGSNLIGSIWNKAAIKTVILDPTDAAITGAAVYGTFTSTDGSAAALGTLGAGHYVKVGRLVAVVMPITYPANANGATALIRGLPFNNMTPTHGGLYEAYGPIHVRTMILLNKNEMQIFNGTTGVAMMNSQLSGMDFHFHGTYIST